MFDTMQLPVAGRGKLTAEAIVSEEGVRIRLDDDARPEFWCELTISRDVLRELLAAVKESPNVSDQ